MTAFRIGLLMAVALLGADLSAEDSESKAPKLVVERPIASGPPTEVTIGIYLLDIAEPSV